MRRSFAFLLASLTGVILWSVADTASAGDALHGEEIYNSRCVACHSPDANRVGPRHRGVVGRKAGSLPDFKYSKAVTGSDVVWDERTLDEWLTNPQAFIPGQRMNFKVADPNDRADIIAYLMTLK
ncbi:MAG: c-type cytochrome [Dongiaceae bacterium]